MRKKVFSQTISQVVSVSLAVVTIVGFTPFSAKAESRLERIVKPSQQYGASAHSGLLAQKSGIGVMSFPEGTSVFSQTDRFAVRIYNSNGFPRLNLYNKQTRRTEMLGVVVTIDSTDAGMIYRATGKRKVEITIAKSGEQTLTIDNVLQQQSKAITGKVSYLPRIALSPTAVVEISLVDISQADAPAIVLSSQKIVSGGRQVPFPFTLPYDLGQIKSRSSYVVQARITVDGNLQFVSKTQFPVITNDSPTEVDVRVEPVDQAQLKNTVWKLEQILYSDGKRLKPTAPSNYTIEFMDDGQFSLRADCNRALGRFTEDDRSLSINLGPTTLAACPPQSIAQDYLRSLQNASSYFFRDDKLFIEIKADTGTMLFSR